MRGDRARSSSSTEFPEDRGHRRPAEKLEAERCREHVPHLVVVRERPAHDARRRDPRCSPDRESVTHVRRDPLRGGDLRELRRWMRRRVVIRELVVDPMLRLLREGVEILPGSAARRLQQRARRFVDDAEASIRAGATRRRRTAPARAGPAPPKPTSASHAAPSASTCSVMCVRARRTLEPRRTRAARCVTAKPNARRTAEKRQVLLEAVAAAAARDQLRLQAREVERDRSARARRRDSRTGCA